MSYADDVRKSCLLNYIEPARSRGDEHVTILTENVHTAERHRKISDRMLSFKLYYL